jgi:hypothetical protein
MLAEPAILRDLRFAIKSLLRSPGLTFVATRDAGARHRREHVDVQRPQRLHLPPAALPGRRPAGALPSSRYPGTAEIEGFQRRALDRLEALPGVESASLSYAMPYFRLGERRAAVALLLIAVALVACYLPARHVSRISPAETLKSQ